MVLATGKGRAKSKLFQRPLREFAAYLFPPGSNLAIRWLPSGANAADKPSRGVGGYFAHTRPRPEPRSLRGDASFHFGSGLHLAQSSLAECISGKGNPAAL